MTDSATGTVPPEVDAATTVLACAIDGSDETARFVLDHVTPDDLTRSVLRDIFAAVGTVAGRGDAVSKLTVHDELVRGGQRDAAAAVLDLDTGVPSLARARTAAGILHRETARRRVAGALGEARKHIEDGGEPSAVAAWAATALDTLANGSRSALPEPSPHVAAFLAQDDGAHDWLVPQVLERTDRLLVTGPEGGGKSTLLRQVAVQVAAGIHPFVGEHVDPARVLLLDLENSARHVRRQLRPLVAKAGDRLDPDRLRIVVRPEGLDLIRDEDAAWLEARLAADRPDLLVTGPLYKLAGGDPKDEEPARAVAQVFDRLRTRYGVALVIEAHSPYGGSGHRPERPYGASLWSRWPEFGIHLSAQGALRHWRGARDERAFPSLLHRGGDWPWTVPTSPDEERWARILTHCDGVLTRPSQRDLAAATGIPRSTLQRILDAHQDEWEALFAGEPTA